MNTETSLSDSQTPRRRVLLAGAGHAHLYALKRAAEFARRGFELVAVAPEDFWYSGLATGVLGGHYAPEQDQVNIGSLLTCGGEGCCFIRDRVVAIDPRTRSVRLENGGAMSYDVLSVDVGSEVRPIPGEDQSVFPIKPLRQLWRLRQALEAARATGQKPRVCVAGGGASGCEIAANVRALLGRDAVEITLLARGNRLVPEFPSRAGGTLARWLSAHGIRVRFESGLARIENDCAITERGERHPFDYLVNATGLHPPALLAAASLPVTERGELLVDEFLRSTGDPRIFGGGDCVAMRGESLEKIGVFAVREAPILFHNLLATLESAPLRAFRPQRHCLLILNLGNGIGLARWRRFHWLGKSAFWLKDRIDRAFLAQYQVAK